MILDTSILVRFTRKLCLGGFALVAGAVPFAASADAQTYYYNSTTPQVTYASPVLVPASYVQPAAANGLAQRKASRAARMGIRGHLGGGLGQAKYEGVGWSNQSAQAAIENCCYWGARPVTQIGVSRGADGFWYACVLYR